MSAEFLASFINFILPLVITGLFIFYCLFKKVSFLKTFCLGFCSFIFSFLFNLSVLGINKKTLDDALRNFWYKYSGKATIKSYENIEDIHNFLENFLVYYKFYDNFLKYIIFAIFMVISKIIIFKFFLKKDVAFNFKEAVYFSFGTSFFFNFLWRFSIINSWYCGFHKPKEIELIFIGINSLFIFIFEIATSVFILNIIKKKIKLSFIFYLLIIIWNSFLFFIIKVPIRPEPIGLFFIEYEKIKDYLLSDYNINFNLEVILIFFVILSLVYIFYIKNKFKTLNLKNHL